MAKDCIFCKIASHQSKAEIVFEDKQLIVFKDNSPSAPVHLLITTKKHIKSVNQLQKKDASLLSHMFFVAQKMAIEQKVDQSGYKLIFNVGRGGGQIIDHLHLHLMGGDIYGR